MVIKVINNAGIWEELTCDCGLKIRNTDVYDMLCDYDENHNPINEKRAYECPKRQCDGTNYISIKYLSVD